MESVHGTVAGLDVHKKTVVVVVLQSDHSDEDHAAGVFVTTRYGLNELSRSFGNMESRTRRWNQRPSIGGLCGWHLKASSR
jgi:hypothetical protein